MDALAKRLGEVQFETFELRNPIVGLDRQPLVPLEEALEPVQLPDKKLFIDTALTSFSSKNDGHMSKDEKMAIYLYTCEGDPPQNSLYAMLNNSLRDRDRTKVKPYLPYVKLFNAALQKRMTKVGKKTLWRGVAKDLYSTYFQKKGEEITFWGYTSTTTDMSVLDEFIPLDSPHRTLFSIRASAAADLTQESAFAGETEMLIPAGTVFKVLNVHKAAENLTMIELVVERNLLGICMEPPDESPDESPPKKQKLSSEPAPAITSPASAAEVYRQGKNHEDGAGKPKDYHKAREHYERAATMGSADAHLSLGLFYEAGRGGLARSDSDALRHFRAAAEGGVARAQNKLAVFHDCGRGGLAKDAKEALTWYRRAAEGGYVTGQYNLGLCYLSGQGVPADEREAAAWFRRAAEQGDADAQYSLGVLLREGRGGLPKEEDKAREWLRRAAEQGHDKAKEALQTGVWAGVKSLLGTIGRVGSKLGL